MTRSLFARAAGVALAAALTVSGQAHAWESEGHRIISVLGVAQLPAEIPAFLKEPTVIQQMGELGREPDRSRGAGQPHDEDLDPGHFMDVTDDGHGLGGISLTDMPRNRDAYSAALHAAGADLHKGGWLYYNLVDGYEQLSKDFAYWRIDGVGEKRAKDAKQRAWYAMDRKLRELIIIRDLGYWSHFVGDASQPLHASIHYNGWGDFPNPHGYTNERIHSPFEGAFITANVKPAMVQAAMPAPHLCTQPIGKCMGDYLIATNTKVEPLYALWQKGGFQPGDKRGVEFATAAVAEGAAKLRDFVVQAWRDSPNQTVGYPGVKVSAIEAGAELSWDSIYGN